MTVPDRPPVKEPVPDWWFFGVIGLVFGGPMLWLVGAAFLQNPLAVLALAAPFGFATWWFIHDRKHAAVAALTTATAATASRPPIAISEAPGVETWVPWATLAEPRPRARPIHVASAGSLEYCLKAFSQELPPLDTDLRFTTKLAKGSADRWMCVDREQDRALVSLHLEGSSFPNVSSSVGIDGVIYDTATGAVLDAWLRPSVWSRAGSIGLGVMYLGLALFFVRGVAGSSIQAHPANVFSGVAGAAVFAVLGIAMVRKQRQLSQRLVGELVATVEQATGSTVRTPPEHSVLPHAPARVMTSTEREVEQAMTGARSSKAEPVTAMGCLRLAALAVTGTLLILGSILIVA